MKKILLYLLFAVFTLSISAQAPSKKCPTCGLSMAKCQYKGKHPHKNNNTLTVNRGNSNKTNPYSIAMKKGRDYYKNYNYSEAIKHYESLFQKFPSHSIEIRAEIYIDEKGRFVLMLPYHRCGNFSDGFAYFDKEVKGAWKYGYIDKKGNVIIEAIYDYACDYSEGFAMIKKGNKWGLIDKFGNCSLSYQ